MATININYSDEEKKKIRIANMEYVNSLRAAISNQKIDEFFNSFGFKPRFLEIIDILLCYQDGQAMVNGLYEYILANVKDVHIPAIVQRLSMIDSFHSLIIRDFEQLYSRSLNSSNIITNNIINFSSYILKIPESDPLIIAKSDEILSTIDPTLVSYFVLQFKDKPYFKELVKNNFDRFMTTARGNATIDLVKLMLQLDSIFAIKYISDNFTRILNNTGGGNIYSIICIFSNYDELAKLIQKNIETVIDCSNASDVNNLLNNLDEKLNLGLLKNNDVLILLREKLSAEKQDHLAIGAIIKSKRNEYIKSLLNDMIKQEKVTDFRSVGDNSWSNLVFRIGNKVLKLGWIRNNPHCAQHYRIIQPEIDDIIYDKDGDPILYIETQPFLSQDNISEEDIQDFYNDLEQDGYVYIDPRGKDPTNFGVLSDGEAFKYLDNPMVSESFKRKSLVLIDRDCVWHKDDPDINYMSRY